MSPLVKKIVSEAFKFLAGALVKKKLAENTTSEKTKPIMGAKVVELGSGFDVEKDREKKRLSLRMIIENSMNAHDMVSRDTSGDGIPETFCNIHTRRVAQKLGCFDFPQNTLANKMVDIMEKGGNWRKDTAERAVAHAEKGGLAIAGKRYKGHGHVAPIYPTGSMYLSGSWGKMVPYIGNVGKTNGVMGVSKAFSVADGEPGYYLWGTWLG